MLPPLQDRFSGNERLTRARYSIPYFVSANSDSLIQCLPSCFDAENPPKYEPVLQKDYSIMRFRMQYEKKNDESQGGKTENSVPASKPVAVA